MRRKLLIALATVALLYCAFQPTTYHNHRTGNRVVTVQLPTGEAGYNAGFFYCGKGEC